MVTLAELMDWEVKLEEAQTLRRKIKQMSDTLMSINQGGAYCLTNTGFTFMAHPTYAGIDAEMKEYLDKLTEQYKASCEAFLRKYETQLAAIDFGLTPTVVEDEAEDDGIDYRMIPSEVLEKVNRMDRLTIVGVLESISIQCYDHETAEELRIALLANIQDGTIPPEDLDTF